MAWRRVYAGSLLIFPVGTNLSEICIKTPQFISKEMYKKISPENGGHFVSASIC